MKQRFLLVAAVTSLCTAFAGEAAAQQNSGDYPVRLVSRPQTIPARTLRLDGQIFATHLSACASTGIGTFCASATSTNLNLGGAFGITNEFEVGATVAPLQLTESFSTTTRASTAAISSSTPTGSRRRASSRRGSPCAAGRTSPSM